MLDVMEFNRASTKKCEKSEKEIYAMLPFFHNAVIMGDSVAESILDFRLLRKNNVIAKRGRSIDKVDGDLLRVYCLQPKIVFMEYGKNDIRYFHGNERLFIDKYKKVISCLYHHGVEDVYVNSIIPMREDMQEIFGGKEAFVRFNRALREMCCELNIIFVDNQCLVTWEDETFEYDGIHPKYPYYPKWLQHMIKCADLKKEE